MDSSSEDIDINALIPDGDPDPDARGGGRVDSSAESGEGFQAPGTGSDIPSDISEMKASRNVGGKRLLPSRRLPKEHEGEELEEVDFGEDGEGDGEGGMEGGMEGMDMDGVDDEEDEGVWVPALGKRVKQSHIIRGAGTEFVNAVEVRGCLLMSVVDVCC